MYALCADGHNSLSLTSTVTARLPETLVSIKINLLTAVLLR